MRFMFRAIVFVMIGLGSSIVVAQQEEPIEGGGNCETFATFSDPERPPEQSPGNDFPNDQTPGGDFISFESGPEQSECADQTASSTRTQTVMFVGDLLSRIGQVRGTSFERRSQTSALSNPYGGAASADGDISNSQRFSPFLVFDVNETDRRATDNSRAYDQDNRAVIIGADYRFSDSLIAGASLSYVDFDTQYEANQGSNDVENVILGFHASKYWGNTYLDALAIYGQIDLDAQRNSSAFGGGVYKSSSEGDFHTAELAVGHMFGHKQWNITPSVRLLHLRGVLDRYTETRVDTAGAGGAITFEDQPFESLNARASLQVDYPLLTNWGVLIPSFYYAYHHEYIGAESVTSNAGGGLTQMGEDPTRNYRVGRINLSAQFKHGLSGFLSYESLIKHELMDRDSLALGVRLEL